MWPLAKTWSSTSGSDNGSRSRVSSVRGASSSGVGTTSPNSSARSGRTRVPNQSGRANAETVVVVDGWVAGGAVVGGAAGAGDAVVGVIRSAAEVLRTAKLALLVKAEETLSSSQISV